MQGTEQMARPFNVIVVEKLAEVIKSRPACRSSATTDFFPSSKDCFLDDPSPLKPWSFHEFLKSHPMLRQVFIVLTKLNVPLTESLVVCSFESVPGFLKFLQNIHSQGAEKHGKIQSRPSRRASYISAQTI